MAVSGFISRLDSVPFGPVLVLCWALTWCCGSEDLSKLWNVTNLDGLLLRTDRLDVFSHAQGGLPGAEHGLIGLKLKR